MNVWLSKKNHRRIQRGYTVIGGLHLRKDCPNVARIVNLGRVDEDFELEVIQVDLMSRRRAKINVHLGDHLIGNVCEWCRHHYDAVTAEPNPQMEFLDP